MKKNHLFTTLLLFISVTSLVGCYKEEDDSRTNCVSDCTVIIGKMLTTGNQPLPNINLEVNYRRTTGFHYSLLRKKAMTKTDDNGLYSMRFYLKDDELLKDDGSFRSSFMTIDLDKLKPELYILPEDMNSYLDESTDPPTVVTVPPVATVHLDLKRDEVCNVNCYIPRKRYVKVTLKGFKPESERDYFEARTFFPWGLEENYQEKILDTKYSISSSAWHKGRASVEEQTFIDIPFALNDSNVVRIMKMKNGVIMSEDYKIYVSEDSPKELVYEY